jgi:peptidoglycan-N-acetylglucosamine deacetylase
LQKHNAKATFFCIGKNIEKHPEIFQKVIGNGHSIGNHTHNHDNGWKTPVADYVKSVQWLGGSDQEGVSHLPTSNFQLFRPPYGKIKLSQSRKLIQLGYKIIMWDVLSSDFDQGITPEKCLKNTISNVTSGSIIVFHDSEKAFRNLKYALPKTLKFLAEKGFICDVI